MVPRPIAYSVFGESVFRGTLMFANQWLWLSTERTKIVWQLGQISSYAACMSPWPWSSPSFRHSAYRTWAQSPIASPVATGKVLKGALMPSLLCHLAVMSWVPTSRLPGVPEGVGVQGEWDQTPSPCLCILRGQLHISYTQPQLKYLELPNTPEVPSTLSPHSHSHEP